MLDKMVSIVVPIYNSEKYLRETIQSVINQSYSDFELLLINDGSTDCTMDILSEIKDKRVKVINKKNTGVSDSRNVAINIAKGEYICFLDADDCYSEYYLERMIHIATENDADMVVCNYMPFHNKPVFNMENFEPIYVATSEKLIKQGLLTSVWTKLIKKSVIEKYSIRFDTNMTFGEDLFFCWKVFLASKKVWFINEKLYGYRMSDNSATSKYHPNLYQKYKNQFSELKKFGEVVQKNDEYEMDVFFTTRMKSFLKMIIREKSSIYSKYKEIIKILNDDVIQKVFNDWNKFEKKIDKNQIGFYKKCKNKKGVWLLLYAYKTEMIIWIKNRIKKIIW